MIRAENIPRVIETSAVRLYFCHDWAMASQTHIPSSRQALSI